MRTAFAYCDNSENRADAEALEVWCGAVGVTLDSALAAKARIAPLLEAAALEYCGPAAGARSFDELAELVLVKEVGRRAARPARAAFFADKCDDGQAVIACSRPRAAATRSRGRTRARFADLDELPMSSLGA